jgi:hypothetical protein
VPGAAVAVGQADTTTGPMVGMTSEGRLLPNPRSEHYDTNRRLFGLARSGYSWISGSART